MTWKRAGVRYPAGTLGHGVKRARWTTRKGATRGGSEIHPRPNSRSPADLAHAIPLPADLALGFRDLDAEVQLFSGVLSEGMIRRVKTCGKCLRYLADDAFAKHVRDRTQNSCKECRRIYNRAHYAANKQYYIDKAGVRKQAALEVNRAIVLEAFKDGCVDCKTMDFRVLEFDHLSDKEFMIGSKLGYIGPDRLRAEIAKCDVVCANCHKIRTAERAGTWRALLMPPL